ncbi:hypothetical protein Nmel_014403 [Mimus melanotis]
MLWGSSKFRAVLTPLRVPFSEDKEIGSFQSPKEVRCGAWSSPSSHFHIGAAMGKPA